MGKERSRSRITCKIDRLPPDVKKEVDAMLSDSSNKYWEISEWLKEQGHDISTSSVGRYAIRIGKATARLMEAQRQAEALAVAIRANPDADYTEAAMRILMDGLVNKLATAEEEFDEMSLADAGKLVTNLSRTKAYKDKVRQDMMSRMELAFKGMESEIMQTIKGDAELAGEMKSILQKTREKMLRD